MPLYEYFCPHCNLSFELIRPLSQSEQDASCPHCGNKADPMVSSFACFSKSSDGAFTKLGGSPSCSTCRLIGCGLCL